MSRIISTFIPLLNKEIILKALDNLEVNYILKDEKIVIESKYYGFLKKENNGQYLISGDEEVVGSNFQKLLVNEYKKIEEDIKIQKEKEKIELEKKIYIEKKKNEIYALSKKNGYSVKETNNNGEIKLVLIKRTY
jgi:hypothetical protein